MWRRRDHSLIEKRTKRKLPPKFDHPRPITISIENFFKLENFLWD
jgi:hypothetical protein